MSFRIKAIFVAMLLTTAMACGSSSPTAPAPAPTTVNATIDSRGFSPDPINISVGSTVMWTNKDSSAHAVVADSGAFSSGAIAPGGQYSYRFPAAGTFTYHDTTSAGMVGTVNVSGSSPSPSPY